MWDAELFFTVKASAPAGVAELCGRIMFATVLGAAVGINRELHQKPAGFRTHAMVALGSSLMVVIASGVREAAGTFDAAAVSRVLQGLIAGIGFVGGGAILRQDQAPNVHGLTTATSIWVVAAVGAAAGLGLWAAAAAAVAIALLVLSLGRLVDRRLGRMRVGPDPDA